MLLADIASGETGWADVFFLIGVIVFGLAAVVQVGGVRDANRPYPLYSGFLVALGLMFVALGFLVL